MHTLESKTRSCAIASLNRNMQHSYYSLSTENATKILQALRRDESPNTSYLIDTIGDDTPYDVDAEALRDSINSLLDSTSGAAAFEAKAAQLVYEHLKALPLSIVGNPGFWSWLTLGLSNGMLAEIVMKRYSGKDSTKDIRFGITRKTNMLEGLFFRLWWRAHCLYEPETEDPFRLSKRGDIDTWDSHIFGQDYGRNNNIKSALLEHFFPDDNQTKLAFPLVELRKVANRIYAYNAVRALGLLSPEQSKEFITQCHTAVINSIRDMEAS